MSGWFQDRSTEIDPWSGGSVYKRLVSFVEYKNVDMQDNDVVLIRIGRASLFLQYNRGK